MSLRFAAIADDVTGATDLCGALARAGLRPVQTIGPWPAELPQCDAVVVALKSRTAPVAAAVAESLRALAWLQELDAERIFFKYCSTFDSTPEGNIGPVADALLDALGEEFTVVCPAYPENGRTVYLGHLFVHGRLLSESSLAHHPLTPMTDADLVRVLGRQTQRPVTLVPHDVVARGAEAIAAQFAEGYAVVDAIDGADLIALGAACRELRLVTGAAGLGEAVASALGLPPRVLEQPAVEGPAAVIAGSCSQATMAQVERMASRHTAIRLEPRGADVGDEAVAALAAGPVLVYASAPPEEREAADAAAVEERLGAVARRLADAGARRIVVAGGETSAAVVQALGIRVLQVGAEIARGVPWMTTVDEPRLALALKSGNFGGPDFFLEAVA
ncbi:MAG TPA: 3-oxo-tetronate kinase [Gaiellaceae bacterium]|nr:3-oxo-tetronate kinase [Gaiellaceae bacterium]